MVAPPRNAFAFLTPCSVFLYKGDFAVCGQRPKGSALWKPATFEKVDETFIVVLICADFFILSTKKRSTALCAPLINSFYSVHIIADSVYHRIGEKPFRLDYHNYPAVSLVNALDILA